MFDVFLAYIGFTIGMIIGWLKFLPRVVNKNYIYKTFNLISLFFMTGSYFPYKKFIENLPDGLALKHLLFLVVYFLSISFVMNLIINYFKRIK
ncbi:hypothetical protein AAX05_00290 [Moraxella bovoculi]|uniref:Uncharacterized protein n=1 Tax=Moraxella bovoculi TaxID=386891 RepID=A0AAC8T7A0_9GAMM|nr:hypothetical protein [Moraxella bovoculi]AKG06892.1 hypothetical protein AAX06_00290 [Moraxella bovoculi]AKG08881.1 hypothetical protein AAX05_00290 [Moraxella bovoculi]AKG10712.1 hypothetical protein AAX07_00290 [Moraxella bovoculi]AKG12751.1 hypothetical protein AAX11_00290 [Moraxella bovoculi]